ncbi:Nitroreductase family protein [Actinacidiphila alni]|uniref:Nitroreductase family protein n=1 Tax=Actinacidiphila alni TaxID=380248 RepID=A0A1I2APC3_9ACTN|nr:nitroreductase family protein [Actinacidiphila alni]SFE45418.1 Nitroreductase family protein [Actinacidiphila alni]
MRTTALDAATLEKLVSAAIAAPSIHNTQPWRFRLDPLTTTVEVRAATERALRTTDPLARALHLSVGAAVFNLRVAVAHFGWEPVPRLLPDPAEPGLLASVRLAGPVPGDRSPGGPDEHHPAHRPPHRPELYDVLWRRHSSRLPFSDRPLPADVLAELTEAAHAEGARLTLPDALATERLMELTAEAERRSVGDPARRQESRRWIREGAPDGMPGRVLGPQDVTGRVPLRDFSALRPEHYRPAVAFERNPVIAVLSTAHDRRADWLRAGQALEHVLLVATAHGARTSLLHQALEWPDLRWVLRDPRDRMEHVQMLIRLGYGPDGPASPRRPAAQVTDEARGTAAT